jgi:hypothetical protein
MAGMFSAASAPGDAAITGVRLHLLREAVAKDNVIRVEDVAVASGGQDIVERVLKVPLGTISLPEQEVVIDRYTIMSRLGSSGIDTSLVSLAGAEKVAVGLRRSSVTSAELLASARKYALHLTSLPEYRLRTLDQPADVNLGDFRGRIRVVPSLLGQIKDDPLKVKLAVISSDGRELGVRQVSFVRSAERPAQSAGAAQPGQAPVQDSPKVVFRNQPVVIEIETEALKVTAMGLPLEDGRTGQLIKVRNIDSKRDIVVRVRPDGTVSPVL